MLNVYNDRKYMSMVQDIVENEEFQKTRNFTHHQNNRFDHSLRVSYYSYKISKLLHLSTEEVARAGLLHDFFLVNNQGLDKKDRMKVMVEHPNEAVINSKKYFTLTEKEEDIIKTHMFPIGSQVPKYLESWIVDIVDDGVALYEASVTTRKHITAVSNFLLIFLINYLR